MRVALTLIAAALGGVLASGQSPPLKSGLNPANFDTSIRPQDDLYKYVNGGWASRATIPADRVSHGLFTELADKAQVDLRALVEHIANTPNRQPGSPVQQIGDLYASLMDQARLDALGAQPIEAELARIEAVASASDLSYRAGHLAAIGSGAPFGGTPSNDATNPGQVIVTITQGGTLLPDRDYYLNADAKYAAVRAKYRDYLTRIFQLTARRDPEGDAAAVMALESALAEAQLPQTDAGGQHRTAARYALRALMREMPGFDWIAWARAQGIDAGSDVILTQPSFFKRFAALVPATPMTTWRAWLAARHITAAAPYLSAPFVDARFEFFGRILSGQEVPITHWKSAVSLVSGYLGDAVGKVYVERHFSPQAKRRVEALVADMLEAMRQAIAEAPWMTRMARDAALAKVGMVVAKVGYPDRWREYSGLVIRADDLAGNIQRAQQFENAYRMALLRRPAGRSEWLMPPQTVNAFYRPGLNEIVVPAAMLQPPMFQMDADDAVNYGGIGAVIGHELGHGFDERGRNFDGAGAMRDWWTAQDAHAFQQQCALLVEQYSGYRSIDGMRVNGALTLGENVGDLSGLALAYRAYKISLKGKTPAVIDGFSGDQRFFLGWAQVWRMVLRDEYLRQWLLWIPHAPPEYRANGPLRNIDGFYAAFNVQPGDKLYVDPGKRVRIW